MKKLLPCFAGLIFGSAVGLNAQTTVHASLDFETTQYPNNFRVLNLNGATLSQTTNGAANDFFRSQNGSGASIVYDANGSAANISNFNVSKTVSLNVSMNVSFSTSTNSFGIYVINANNETQGYLAIFNVNNSGANDTIRFASAVVNPGNPGTVGSLPAGSYANNQDLGIGPTGTFNSYSFSYSINSNNEAVLSMTATGTSSVTSTYTIAGTAFTNVEVGFRLGSSSGTIGMDNLNISTVSTIPEPSTFGILAGAAVLGMVATRRRIVR